MANGTMTESGRELREAIEVATDGQCEVIIDALGEDAEELIQILTPWGNAVRSAGGYPPQGPHDLAPS